MSLIGYYVHHHGDGHRQRALAIAESDPSRYVLLGTNLAGRTGQVTAIDLPDDRLAPAGAFDGEDGEHDRPESLHYAPLRHQGVRARMTTIAQWIAQAQPGLIVSDVSVEIAMLARLCATPVAYVRLGGRRTDTPHLDAFRGATVLIAPFAEALEDRDTPDWIRRKTIYAPGIVPQRSEQTMKLGTILVVCGRGGSTLSISAVIDAACHMPQHRWRIIGLAADAMPFPDNLEVIEWTDRPEREIARAEIVVGAAGDGLVGAVLAARRPFICIPEARPFDEQMHRALALQHAGAAVVLQQWPDATRWPHLIEAARALVGSSSEVGFLS